MSSTLQSANNLEARLQLARQAAYTMANLSTEQKNQALETFARLITEQSEALLSANQQDLSEQKDKLSSSLYQRLKLDATKLGQLVQGIHDVIGLDDPVGEIEETTQLDDGLTLQKVAVPIGVIAIIFESRPDVIPQILSLILKSGNAVLLKGGSEAIHSNQAFMTLIDQLNTRCPWLPPQWAQLLDSRQAVQEMLSYPQYVDLVIPRGSNQLVQSIMAATQIPVLGHADGVCHIYVHQSADLSKALPLVIDAKAQYPAACNAAETLLIDHTIAAEFLPPLLKQAEAAGIVLKADASVQHVLPTFNIDSNLDWHTEYGEPTLAVRVVEGPAEAIQHINTHGSHHTDAILATDGPTIEAFLNQVDSASVFANASTRFADGFRYGFGAEIGISTAKTHARGPVGMDGLMIHKYKLRGDGHRVSDYVGDAAKPFKHIKS